MVSQKRNGTEVTKMYFKSKLQTRCYLFSKLSLSSLTLFSTLLHHIPMHSWKDFLGILRSLVVTDILTNSSSEKHVPLTNPWAWEKRKIHTEPDVSKEDARSRRCSSREPVFRMLEPSRGPWRLIAENPRRIIPGVHRGVAENDGKVN